ncbi:MAG: acyl-ACP--UDP-N-acetylglucosamine O-acyltransferase [Pirellulales bacterium]
MSTHPLALVSPAAKLGRDVAIGPFCVIESGVTIGDECILESHVIVKEGTTLGPRNHIFEGTILGGLPQHLKMPDRPGDVVIGAGNTIREHVTVHRALEAGHVTAVGDNNLLMVNVHIAHDCRIGSHTIFANNAMMAGHVTVDDRAYVSGAVGVHQFCRIGSFAMVGGQAHIVKDIPPFVTVDGLSSCIVGLNLVGLKRAGTTTAQILRLKAAYRLIYRSGLRWTEILDRLRDEFSEGPAARFHEFFSEGKRGFIQERRLPPNAVIKLRREQLKDYPLWAAKAG